MALAGGVFHQQDITAAEFSSAAVAHFQFDGAVQHYHVLAGRGVVPVVIVVLVVFPEDDPGSFLFVGEKTYRAAVAQADTYVLEVAFAPLVAVKSLRFLLRRPDKEISGVT